MRKTWSFLTILLMVVSLAMPVLAAPSAYVVDKAGLLKAEQKADLEKQIKEVRGKFNFDLVIVTLKDANTNKEPLVFTADYYMDNGYGVGPSRDGLILLLDMTARDWSIVGTGHGKRVFTGWGTSDIGKRILPNLSKGKYHEAFSSFIMLSETFLQADKNGKPITAKNPYIDSIYYDICIFLALAAAVLLMRITKSVLIRQMNTVVPQYGALDYVKDMVLARKEDIFLYDDVVYVKKAVQSSASRKGSVSRSSDSFESSSGSSHSGSSGKF